MRSLLPTARYCTRHALQTDPCHSTPRAAQTYLTCLAWIRDLYDACASVRVACTRAHIMWVWQPAHLEIAAKLTLFLVRGKREAREMEQEQLSSKMAGLSVHEEKEEDKKELKTKW